MICIYVLKRSKTSPDFQVTWSKDHTLRLWQIDPSIQAQCSRDLTSEEASISGGNEDDSPTNSQREKPSGSHFLFLKVYLHNPTDQGCQIFLGPKFQIGKNITNDHKLYQTAINYTDWP
jgi:hypothetical protein